MKIPRVSPSAAQRLNTDMRYITALLPTCKNMSSAQNELRWIRESVESNKLAPLFRETKASKSNDKVYKATKLYRMCSLRGRGYPLQYILGSQPFGNLEIRCRPGVLIPRHETEAWTTHLAHVVRDILDVEESETGHEIGSELKIIDMCTGTGCIALLLYSLLNQRFPNMQVRGYDINPKAVRLAARNFDHNRKHELLQSPTSIQFVSFMRADAFSANWPFTIAHEGRLTNYLHKKIRRKLDIKDAGMTWRRNSFGILVSNPPYISQEGFDRDTEPSVRNWEPRYSLVPHSPEAAKLYPDVRPEDVFYAKLLDHAAIIRPQVIAFEVGDLAQAIRVVQMAFKRYMQADTEIWRDWPDVQPREGEEESVEVAGVSVPIKGSGNGRVVFIRRQSPSSPNSNSVASKLLPS
ncbi:S-adenosyl-L-methionine-dependent methyltransferase [Daldinia caldariorum]|uniref:S-adenosyl-L-methionine-dependent methyltransferase n=1 Tax=Daldinia caldariorum TaxID=326644 RepID=UPI002008997E|nr:S-adenosyl-L-methionine-dependent methyltransferase [Daldinia caldariorum]KAI1469706.1 S-adenosyl-L-methionine-dependent methyltransferase [Daldinia caldariorum]